MDGLHASDLDIMSQDNISDERFLTKWRDLPSMSGSKNANTQ